MLVTSIQSILRPPITIRCGGSTGILTTLLLLCTCVTVRAESIDLIIAADYVVTMDDKDTVIENGAIAIDNGEIVAIDATDSIDKRFQARNRISGSNRVLMPGLINGHAHSAMTIFRGIADDSSLVDWLMNYIFPAEIRFVDENFVRVGTQLACLEMIKGGTTSFVDMYFHPKEVATVVDECGLRALVGASIIEQESGYTKNFDDAMTKAESFVDEWKNKNSRITPALAPNATFTITPENLKIVRERANLLGVPVAIHFSESQGELEIVEERYGTTPIALLESIDFFTGPTIGAHVVWPTEEEILLLAKHGVGAIHNPTSNLKLASGIAPIPEMLAAGVPVGLATDGAASNNDLDMWDEIHLAALLHKGRLLDPKIMPAKTALSIATRGGADAIGLGQHTGSITVGRRADVIQISLDEPHLVPVYDVVSHLAYAVDAQDVQTVIVDGVVLMKDRTVFTLDEDAVIRAAKDIAAQVDAEIRTRK